MAGINIRYDGSDLLRFADDMRDFGDELPAACARALNCTGDMVATQMGRTLSEETGLGVRDIRSDFEVSKASPDDLEYTITVPSRQTTLGEFAPHPTRKGVSARPWGERRVFPGSFEVRDEVYHRLGKERYPIAPLYGPDIAREAARGETTDVIVETFERVMPERLDHEIGRVMKRRGGESNDDGGGGE